MWCWIDFSFLQVLHKSENGTIGYWGSEENIFLVNLNACLCRLLLIYSVNSILSFLIAALGPNCIRVHPFFTSSCMLDVSQPVLL
ncbi:hypothetical protein PM8797T_04685 [Gimesia maris DSM 8797]|nr:hypothetical protein PM8797T_04685 [Gimesia maris DSM 8797]